MRSVDDSCLYSFSWYDKRRSEYRLSLNVWSPSSCKRRMRGVSARLITGLDDPKGGEKSFRSGRSP
jgi:hypothetical protein